MKNCTHKFLTFAACLLAVLAISCDEDATNLGGSIIGGNNFDTDVYEGASVVSYAARTTRVQTNFLNNYQLGIYNDPIYGKTTSNLLTQVQLAQTDPDFGDEAEFVKVTMDIPYFATLDVTSSESDDYVLDSVYGESPIKISMYRSNYFLRDFDPDTGFEEPQKYYSDQGPTFEAFLGELIYEEMEFLPSDTVVVENEGEDDEETLAPRWRVDLPVDYFKELILDREGSPELSSNGNFTDFFRGIYFKVEALSDNGVLFYFDISQAAITIDYQYEAIDVADSDNDGDTTDPITLSEVFVLAFAGNVVNVFETEFSPDIEAELADQDEVNGEKFLYLKGGEGSVAVIDLFGPDEDGDGEADELTILKENDWLINEANLEVFIAQGKVTGGESEPERLFLYDMDNGRVLIDYEIDNTFANNTAELKSSHLGIVKRNASDEGVSYKLRLTTHISNILRRDSTNVRLGLAVAQEVLSTNFLTVEAPSDENIKYMPSGGVASPEGTVVFGNAATNENKRLKLTIYYTDPE
ncbi:MAG: DUF4270 domain-containing protein [Gilvibacter sp.]